MATETEPQPKLISLSKLDAVLERARLEGWRELAILGSSSQSLRDPNEHTFFLREPIGAQISKLVSLTGLTSLHLRGNQIGDEGARVLAELTGLTSLDLRVNQIGTDGARALTGLTELTTLALGFNQIGNDGARALTALTRLTALNLSFNQIGNDGARALTALTELTDLTVQDNKIGNDGARALAALTGLTNLTLSDNQIGNDGARDLAALTGLTSLMLSDNQIGDDGAHALAALTRLTALDLSFNQIGNDGARALAALTKLIVLNLNNNQIGNDGARALAALTRPVILHLSFNQIGAEGVRALLDAWCDAPNSTRLGRLSLLHNRDIESLLPREVLESRDAQSILAAYRRYRNDKLLNALQPLNEAKLVVVGNEAVGKTSLIRYLVHDIPCDPREKKTAGTAIHEKIEVSKWSMHQCQVRLNVWDFGGQEIMRGTHRFFLTERSLYLLVLEDRREDDRSIYEWLEIIAQRGGDSPVIVVVNKSDTDVPQHQLDEDALRRNYPAIAGFARTSCNPGAARSIANLRDQIATTLSESARLKHVRDPIPRSWLRVKEAIAKQARSHSVLPVRDFERLCEGSVTRTDERITDPNEQRALLALLHDLGVVVAHGLRRDAPAVRREITILDPNWLTGAIYALINSPTVRDQGGELRGEQLGELLDPARYPASRHELILNMMQEPELGLCLPLAHGGSNGYLLPDALPIREPDYVQPAEALRFRFQYSLLPKEFIPRFIVEAHQSLTDKPTWWRHGVVLGAEGCRILVRGDTARNRVEIQVEGKTGQRAALSIVRNYFDAVHRYYAKLSVKARVPLPDQPEVDVGYEHLVTLEQKKGLDYKFLPEDADREYSVGELLEGVRDDARRRRFHESWSAGASLEDSGDVEDRAPRPARSTDKAASNANGSAPKKPMTAANSELPAEQPAQDTGDRSSLIAAICSAVAAAAYAAWFLYGERTRAMILPPIAGLVFAIVWSLRASAFYRRMVGILVGIGSTSAAVPTLVVAAKGPDHQLDAKITGTSVVFSVGCIAGAVVFGILNYMSSRKPRRDSRPD